MTHSRNGASAGLVYAIAVTIAPTTNASPNVPAARVLLSAADVGAVRATFVKKTSTVSRSGECMGEQWHSN